MNTPDLKSYDHIIVAFSGGKDSLACVLHLLEQPGIDRSKIELWHHLVDGREGSTLMDWPVTEDYCRKVAAALGVKIRFSWRTGGFEREMNKDNARTAPTRFEDQDGKVIECGGTRGKLGTRLKFPQVSGDLRVRWCSAALKIDVYSIALKNQPRFRDCKTLTISGERAEESANRAGYLYFEPDRADQRAGKRVMRHVDRWRPVHKWSEKQVWEIIERHQINPHPAYLLGWGRLSCMTCIFGSCNQWASIKVIAPDMFAVIAEYERVFNLTIHRTESIEQRAASGTPYKSITSHLVQVAMSKEYTEPVKLSTWTLPAGAFGESDGPT